MAQARNGREAIDQFEAQRPDICFLDVHMPGTTGVEAARHIGPRAHLVFVTAYDQYAVQAFCARRARLSREAGGAVAPRQTVARLQERLRAAQPALNTEELLRQLAASLQKSAAPAPLRWLRASVGQTVRLIAVDDIDFLRSEEKYTMIAWRDDAGAPRDAVIRMPLKELVPQLDPSRFAQVHRSVVVNLRAIAHVTRGANETADIHLKGRDEVLPVSRSYLHLFRQM